MARRWIILFAAIMAFLPVVIDMTILHVAAPTLARDLQADGQALLWILDIYPLVMAGLLVPMGTLGDRIGHRRLMLAGLTIFMVASVGAAFSTTPAMLIAARAVLAVGGSMIMPAVLAVIRQSFEDSGERASALGVWTVVGSAGGAVGPLVGGLLLEHFWWGAVFLVNVPIMLAVIPLVFFTLPHRASLAPPAPWNIGQALIFTAGLILAVYAIKAGLKGDEPLVALVAGATGVALLLAFGRLQHRSADSLLDLSLFRQPTMASGLAMAFIASSALAGFELILAQELQYVLGKTPLEAGLYMLPLVIACAVGGPFGGHLASLFGLRTVAVSGLVIMALAMVGIAVADLDRDWPLVALLLIMLGFAIGVSLLAASVAVMGAVSAEKAGAAGALESTGYELGAALGIAVFGSMINLIYRTSWTPPDNLSVHAAGQSVGEAMILAGRLNYLEADRVREAAAAAFSSAHAGVLGAAAALIALAALAVFFALQATRRQHR